MDNVAPLSSFSVYADKSLITCLPPENPSWVYKWSRYFGFSLEHRWAEFRALMWFVFAGKLILWFWHIASTHKHTLKAKIVLGWSICRFAFTCFVNICAPWPAREEAKLDPEQSSAYRSEIGCIVPCHKSSGEIGNTVASLLKHLKPEHIVVVDNGNSWEPLDDTKTVVHELDPRIVYLWVPIGLKSNALWVGLNNMPETVKYVMHIDDDTICPDDMIFDESIWNNPKTDAISYGICMFPDGVVQRLVDFEFKTISQFRLFESYYSTVWFQHGIIGIWRRSAFTEVMKEHPFLPFGEDNWNGTINLLHNRQMRQELRSCVHTFAPSSFLPCTGSRQQGYGAANLWKQRAERWCVNAPRRFLIRLYLFFFYRHDTIVGNIVFRILSALHLLDIFANLGLPFSLVAAGFAGQLDVKLLLLLWCLHSSLQTVSTLVVNYVFWRHRPDIQIEWYICLLVPFYNAFLQVCTVYGHWRCLLYYIPFFPCRYGLYTEGYMTQELLENHHKIRTVCDDDSSNIEMNRMSDCLCEPTEVLTLLKSKH